MTNELKTMLRAELSAIDAQAETLATRKSAIMVLLDKPATIAEAKPVEGKPMTKPIVGSTAKEVAAKLAAARLPAAQSVRKGRGQGRRADLTEQEIADIRAIAKLGTESHLRIGEQYAVSRSTVANIVNHKGRFA